MRKRTPDERCYTVAELATYLGVADDTVRGYLRGGLLAYFRLPNGEYRIRPDHLQLLQTERMRSGRMERAKRGRAGVALAGSMNATPAVAGLLDGSDGRV